MPLPRFRIRTLMIAIAIGTVCFECARLYRVRRSYLKEASFWAAQETSWTHAVKEDNEQIRQYQSDLERAANQIAIHEKTSEINVVLSAEQRQDLAEAERFAREAIALEKQAADLTRRCLESARTQAHISQKWLARVAVLRQKFERAARYPWLPVPPEPK